MKRKTKIIQTLGWLVTVLIPLIVIMISIRILISPVYAQIEYRLPGFPEDPFGFSLEDRVKWATPSINYLVNSEDISFLGSLKFETGAPIFIERELGHMEDVKGVVYYMRIALAAAGVLVLIINILAVAWDKGKVIIHAYRRGGWGVIGVITGIMIFVALNFSQLFTWFHKIFFESGTWQFFTSDTLIRLFPMRFWQDAFIFVGVFSMIIALIIIFLSKKQLSEKILKNRRSKRSV